MTEQFNVRAAAHAAMLTFGFAPDFPEAAVREVQQSSAPTVASRPGVLDQRTLPWSSIDNDSTLDLDQLEVVEPLPNGDIRVRIAIADVAESVVQGSATDQHAALNASSVYTGVETFAMLPERMSTDLTSLKQDADRLAVVIEFVVATDGELQSHNVYLAFARNHAKLTYGSVGAWLDGQGTLPPVATNVIQEQVRLQDEAAKRLRADRLRRGSLSFETIEAQPILHADGSIDIELVRKTRASRLIEDFMVSANVVMAQFLDEHNSPSIRRVVKKPERWNRIVALAAEVGVSLPPEPDAPALATFLTSQQLANPDRFIELSLSVVKLLGPGLYVLHEPSQPDIGHFGLATQYYTHSTAPNRRYVDLVTQRLLKAVLLKQPAPYSVPELAGIAEHCTERENAARKVERIVRKQAAAASLVHREGEVFDAVVTGVTSNGTFVRVSRPPVEGRVVSGEAGLDVGEHVRVRLEGTDVEKGFIDFSAKPPSLQH
ncbi:MAG: RNB domain-containing ribonuclease [Gemmatimonadaceae bacterium]